MRQNLPLRIDVNAGDLLLAEIEAREERRERNAEKYEQVTSALFDLGVEDVPRPNSMARLFTGQREFPEYAYLDSVVDRSIKPRSERNVGCSQ